MSLSVYLWGICFFTLLSFSAWLGIVIVVDPTQAGGVGVGLFFTSLFAFLLGMMTLCVTWIYRQALGAASAAHHLGGIFRQALLLALFFLGVVFFQMERILTWWDTLLLLAAILLIEFSFRQIFSRNNQD
ncbi:MAG: hypothetical protein WA082_03710 [Candidatus Moraniibacteriota bacterium]